MPAEAWDLIEATLRSALASRALAPAEGISITTVPASYHPRLRGAAALVTMPLFAAPRMPQRRVAWSGSPARP